MKETVIVSLFEISNKKRVFIFIFCSYCYLIIVSKLQYFRENSNETVYRRETLTRIKPIVTKGDVAFGKDSIIPENDIKKVF